LRLLGLDFGFLQSLTLFLEYGQLKLLSGFHHFVYRVLIDLEVLWTASRKTQQYLGKDKTLSLQNGALSHPKTCHPRHESRILSMTLNVIGTGADGISRLWITTVRPWFQQKQ
jgi:hypothetical protein